jgi:hypothetical protein
LSPETNYKIRFEVTPPTEKSSKSNYADTATIKTKPTTFTARQTAAKKDSPIELLDHSVKLGILAQHGDHITIVDTKGQALLSHFVAGSETAVSLPSSAKGVVLLTYTRNGNIVASKRVTIVH